MKRGLTVLKMRGSVHDRSIREFNIDASGMHLGRRFGNVTGILGGAPMHVTPGDVERSWSQFDARVDARFEDRARQASGNDPADRRQADAKGTSR
jgi:hypothetical protein